MIPFDRLVLSQANVRRRKANVSIDDLAKDILRRGLLQALNVRPEVDADGSPTGRYHIPAGGRRYRALELLVKQKQMTKSELVPCIVKAEDASTSAEEDSLAENTHREALHPVDQFHAFKALRDQGLGVADIAARFFVTEQVVLQRLRLTTVSPALLEAYGNDEMSLRQLEAFSITDDHGRQEKVWAALKGNSYLGEPYQIRSRLAEATIRANDKRVRFVGLHAYEAAGGPIARDLFSDDAATLLEDSDLVDRLVNEKLAAAAAEIAGEGWKWVHADVSFAYNHFYPYDRLQPENALSAEEAEAVEALEAEADELEAESGEDDEIPDDVASRLGDITAELAQYDARRESFSLAQRARAGAAISIALDGTLAVQRGLVHPDDIAVTQADGEVAPGTGDSAGGSVEIPVATLPPRILVGPAPAVPDTATEEAEDEGKPKPLSEVLVTELSASRTMALRAALGGDPDMAIHALLHAMVVRTMYTFRSGSCLELNPTFTSPRVHEPKLDDSAVARIVDQRHQHWKARLPQAAEGAWDFIGTLSNKEKFELLAHVTSLTVNVLVEKYSQRERDVVQGDQLADALQLDMAAAGWTAIAENYLNRVSKARILEAVTEACGPEKASLLAHLKKGDMAREAERMLAGTGWLPEPLRASAAAAELPAFLVDETEDEGGEGERVDGDPDWHDEDAADEASADLIAAE
jgi:ParB family chromosome partitioning protein